MNRTVPAAPVARALVPMWHATQPHRRDTFGAALNAAKELDDLRGWLRIRHEEREKVWVAELWVSDQFVHPIWYRSRVVSTGSPACCSVSEGQQTMWRVTEVMAATSESSLRRLLWEWVETQRATINQFRQLYEMPAVVAVAVAP